MQPFNYRPVFKILSQPGKIVIVTHWSPDGDAMGSSLGLYNYLIQLGHHVTVITPNEYPDFLTWLPGNKKVIVHNVNPLKAARAVKQAGTVFCLDFNSLKRIDKLGDLVGASSAKRIIIDHHQQPDDFADICFCDPSYSSTAEMVYDFIIGTKGKQLLNRKVADCLYTGIMTDTGSFRFPSTTAKVHRVISHLIEAGARNSEIHNLIFDTNSVDRMKLIGYALSEKMEAIEDLNTTIFSLTDSELKKYNYKKGDTEGLVNYGLAIRGMRFSAFFVERDGLIKISFRSKGDFDVNKFARAHFNGGGHKNAAGGQSSSSISETLSAFRKILKQYSGELSSKKK